jgi:hypothetical protein
MGQQEAHGFFASCRRGAQQGASLEGAAVCGGIGSMLEQEFEAIDMAVPGGVERGSLEIAARPMLLIADVRIRATVEQEFHNDRIPRDGSAIEGRTSGIRPGIHVGTALD